MFSSKMTTTCLIGVVDAAMVGGGDALDIEMPSTAAPAARTPMPPAMSFFPVRNGVSPFRTVGRRSCCRAPRPPAWERNAHRVVARVACCQQQVTDPLRLCNPGGFHKMKARRPRFGNNRFGRSSYLADVLRVFARSRAARRALGLALVAAILLLAGAAWAPSPGARRPSHFGVLSVAAH